MTRVMNEHISEEEKNWLDRQGPFAISGGNNELRELEARIKLVCKAPRFLGGVKKAPDYFNVSPATFRAWTCGDKNPPAGVCFHILTTSTMSMSHSRRKIPVDSPSPDMIRTARLDAGYTQREAAELIHCSQSTWLGWENGSRRMHPAFWDLYRIKSALSVHKPTI